MLKVIACIAVLGYIVNLLRLIAVEVARHALAWMLHSFESMCLFEVNERVSGASPGRRRASEQLDARAEVSRHKAASHPSHWQRARRGLC